MITPTPKLKRGQHAKRNWSNAVIPDSQRAWIEFTTSDEYRAQLTCTHTAFMAGYRAGKESK